MRLQQVPTRDFNRHPRVGLMLPRAAELTVIVDLQGLRHLVGMPDQVWAGFTHQVGDPGANIQHLVALPSFVVAPACSSANLADVHTLSPHQCHAGGTIIVASGEEDRVHKDWGRRE